MSTNLVTRLVCENCGHIFEPGEIGFYSDDEEVWCGNTAFTPIKTPVIHPCVCPNCNTEFETIQTYDNIFKRIVSQSAADQAKATAKCDCTTYVTIEESRTRFERYKRRKERKDYVQLPIAIVIEFGSISSYTDFIVNITRKIPVPVKEFTLKDLRSIAKKCNANMEYCMPNSDIILDSTGKMANAWKKVGLEDACGYFNMEPFGAIDNVVASPYLSPHSQIECKIIFKPFSIKVKGD